MMRLFKFNQMNIKMKYMNYYLLLFKVFFRFYLEFLILNYKHMKFLF